MHIETVPGKGYRFTAEVSRRPRHDADTQADSSPPHESPALPRRHNLPAELTSFVGRRKELEELRQLLAASRLSRWSEPAVLENAAGGTRRLCTC
jgi:hypothetical protein